MVPRQKPYPPRDALDKIIQAGRKIKVLGSLSDTEACRVTHDVEILKTAQTSPKRKKYKLFLYDLLCKSGPQLVLLCIVALGQVKVIDMKTCDRASLIHQIEIKSRHTDLDHPSLRSLAISHQIPNSVNGPYLVLLVHGQY